MRIIGVVVYLEKILRQLKLALQLRLQTLANLRRRFINFLGDHRRFRPLGQTAETENRLITAGFHIILIRNIFLIALDVVYRRAFRQLRATAQHRQRQQSGR